VHQLKKLNPPKLCKVSFRYLLIHIISVLKIFQFFLWLSYLPTFESPRDFMCDDIFNDCVFLRHFGICYFQFLVSHVHKFHIFVAVFLIPMSHVHVSHHIIYLYKVVPIKFVSLEVSCSYWPNWNILRTEIIWIRR
jgi:hypothetical protein